MLILVFNSLFTNQLYSNCHFLPIVNKYLLQVRVFKRYEKPNYYNKTISLIQIISYINQHWHYCCI